MNKKKQLRKETWLTQHKAKRRKKQTNHKTFIDLRTLMCLLRQYVYQQHKTKKDFPLYPHYLRLLFAIQQKLIQIASQQDQHTNK